MQCLNSQPVFVFGVRRNLRERAPRSVAPTWATTQSRGREEGASDQNGSEQDEQGSLLYRLQYGVRISSGIWKTLVGNAPERHAGGVLGDVYPQGTSSHTTQPPALSSLLCVQTVLTVR